MLCPQCKIENEPDARFCSECGSAMQEGPQAPSTLKTRRVYLYALLLVPVLAIAGWIGYYKYILPGGVAAVVNGETISLRELDAEAARTAGSREAVDARLRYAVLNSLITQRLVLQEARKAGVSVSREEIASTAARARSASGFDEAVFNQRVVSQYGSMKDFEQAVERGLLVNKFIEEKVIPVSADPRTGRAALDQWLQDHTAAASVRVTLAEQWSGAGCGCCGSGAGASTAPRAGSGGCRTARSGCGMANRGAARSTDPLNAGEAADAALRYWHEKHGAEAVSAKVIDFGCHMQVDIIKDTRIISSLRYQGGSISEL
ncbi:MAG TPA: SurA N-terminal domain-containing protein [Nitrospirota bacterium]|nr:SurA N-terminal domain-containing protein [Nitrospirota bacterium]